LPRQPNFEQAKNCTDFSYIQKYKNLIRFIIITSLMLRGVEIECRTCDLELAGSSLGRTP